MSAESGPCSQASGGPFGTVSVWPFSRSDLPPPEPLSTATTFGLPSYPLVTGTYSGCFFSSSQSDSQTSTSTFISRRKSAM